MKVLKQIDQLIVSLNNLKPLLSEDQSANSVEFSNLLKHSLENSTLNDKNQKKLVPTTKQNLSEIPPWVNSDYGYDPKNPRKPYMREFMEAISGKSIEKLYEEPVEDWIQISHTASEMLSGVVGSNFDTRDWTKIMQAEDVLGAARLETGIMYDTKIDLEYTSQENGSLVNQIAVIKDNNNNTLREIPNNTKLAEQTLLNFGANKKSIPTNLEERINPEKFDADLLAFLKNFDHSPTSIQQVVVQSASEIIANKISQEIPLEELAKL